MKKAYFKYILALLLLGSNGLAASYIGLTSYEIVFLRSALGSLLLSAIFLFSRRELTARRHGRDMLYIAMSGVAMGADWLLLYEAFAQIGVSIGMLINYLGPVIVMAFAPLVFKERVTWTKVVALFMALSGVCLISGQAVVQGISAWGLLCAGLSAVCYAVMVIFNKMSRQVTGMENSVLQLVFTFLTVAAFVGLKQGFRMEIASWDWPAILWIGLLNTGVGCYLYFSSIGALPVQTVAVCGYLEPLSAVVYSAVFLHERMLPLQMLGAALIIGGALFGECAFKGGGVCATDDVHDGGA